MIEFGPLVDMIVEIVVAGLVPVIGWAATALKRRYDSEVMVMLTDQLKGFAEEGLMMAGREDKKWDPTIDVDSAIAEEAANFAIRQAPKMMKKAGVDEQWVREQVRGLMGSRG